jgi:hypothetical protein
VQSVFLEEYGSTIEFPEDFSGDQIRNAIEKEIIPQLKKQQDEQRAAAERKRKDETGLLDAFGTGLYRGFRQTGALSAPSVTLMMSVMLACTRQRPLVSLFRPSPPLFLVVASVASSAKRRLKSSPQSW